MKRARLLLALLLAILTLSCQRGDEPEPDEPNLRTLFVYMPWSSNLTGYFRTNIADIEKAILKKGLTQERVVVFFSTSGTEAELYEIVPKGTLCRHEHMKLYESPQFATTEGLTEILNDLKAYAPAENYAMIIGGHGMGWLPKESAGALKNATTFRPHYDYTDAPLTRYFGGLSAEYQTDIATLRESLQQANLHMQFILFDDCYMSSIEVAHELRSVTDHLIACPTEIMVFGFPYETIGEHLLDEPNFKALCEGFHEFYSRYTYPYGTLGVTDCREIDRLAEIVREINLASNETASAPDGIQPMDGYNPTIFFDLQDYVEKLCPDPTLLDRFRLQMERTVPYRTHTAEYYSAITGEAVSITAFCGITTSAPSQHPAAAEWENTSWYAATH